MTRLVISAGRPVAVVVISQLLSNFLESNRHAWVRSIFDLRQDVPYVAQTLTDSVLPIHPKGFWQFHSLLEAKEFFLDSPNMPATVWEAKHQADQLLLLLGTGQPSKLRLGALPEEQLEGLKKVGSMLYSLAAEMTPGPEQSELESMSLDFCPWTEVLAEFRQNRPIITA